MVLHLKHPPTVMRAFKQWHAKLFSDMIYRKLVLRRYGKLVGADILCIIYHMLGWKILPKHWVTCEKENLSFLFFYTSACNLNLERISWNSFHWTHMCHFVFCLQPKVTFFHAGRFATVCVGIQGGHYICHWNSTILEHTLVACEKVNLSLLSFSHDSKFTTFSHNCM